MPDVAALPWEFTCLPESANLGEIWVGTDPKLIFARRRSQWHPAPAIQLNPGEKLRIALAIAVPTNLGSVVYEKVQVELEKLTKSKSDRVELLPIVNPATPEAIDAVLEQEPHIFHFIGHGRLQNEAEEEVGQIALVDDMDEALWINARFFGGLFNRHRPGVVMLQACEAGMLSASQAFVGVASKIVQQNIPVVVAMQYEVSNVTASRFAYRFYERLALDDPVDLAVQNGRRAIALNTQYNKRDFATPVIFMRVTDGYLFKRQDRWNNSNNLELPTQSKFTRQQDKFPILSTASPSIKSLEEPKDSQLIIPEISGTQPFKFTRVIIDAQGQEISRSQKQNSCLIEDLGNGVILEMVVIPGGECLMGSPDSEGQRYSNERPQHQVTIKPFLISKYPITQAQWRAVACLPEVHQTLKLRPSRSGGKSHPITKVSWYDAVEFCVRLSHFVEGRLSQKTGREYRLPSEAEWEYACRAGTTTPFHFGETITTNLANYDSNVEKTTPVDNFKIANNFGLFDLHGNVWEWCLDHWHDNYDNAPTDGNEWLDSSENQTRVLRGGSLKNDPSMCRSSYRYYRNPNDTLMHGGFRIVFSL